MCIYLHILCIYMCLYRTYTVYLCIYTLCKHSHIHRLLSHTPFFLPRIVAKLYGRDTPHFTSDGSRPENCTAPVAAGSTSIPEFFPLRTRRLAEAQTNKDMDVIRISRRNFPRYLTLRRDNNGLRSSRRVSWCTNKQLTTYARSPSTRADRHVVRQSGNHFCG